MTICASKLTKKHQCEIKKLLDLDSCLERIESNVKIEFTDKFQSVNPQSNVVWEGNRKRIPFLPLLLLFNKEHVIVGSHFEELSVNDVVLPYSQSHLHCSLVIGINGTQRMLFSLSHKRRMESWPLFNYWFSPESLFYCHFPFYKKKLILEKVRKCFLATYLSIRDKYKFLALCFTQMPLWSVTLSDQKSWFGHRK